MSISAKSPIGIFDSGIGGLTIARAIINELPGEDVIYVGDTAHLPYGDKSAALVKYYAIKITEFLIARGCKIIVIACHTASSVAYDELVEIFGDKVTFVNVVDPVVAYLAEDRTLNKIGIIGTKGTIASGVYARKMHEAMPDNEAVSLATPLLASMIEEGFYNNNISHSIIEAYLSEPILDNIDALVLACTHYPLIANEIDAYYQGKVKVLDSTGPVAHQVRALLQENDLLNDQAEGSGKFFATDITGSFLKTTKVFFGEKVSLESCPIWES